MGKIILFLSLFAGPVYAECNFAKDIIVLPNNVQYSFDCHREVGKTFLDNRDLKDQVKSYEDLVKAQKQHIELLSERGDIWESTAKESAKQIQAIQQEQKYQEYIMFGLGLLTAIATTYAVNQ